MRHTGSMIMTGDRQAEITVRAAREGGRLIRAVHLLSWGLLAALTGGAFLLAGWQTAQSVLIGGLLVNGSFYFLQRDIRQLLRKVSQEGMDFKTVKKLEKVRFILKFYLRLIVLGLVLFVLVQRLHVRLHMVVADHSTGCCHSKCDKPRSAGNTFDSQIVISLAVQVF